MSPGFSCDTAVCPRSEQPSAARTPKPRSVKFSPLRTARPTPSYFTHLTRLIDAALKHQVLHQPADGIVGERRHDRRVQAEAAPQPARDVVFAAAFPDLESARRVDAPVAGIEPQHHLAERHQAPAAVGFGAQRERHAGVPQPPSTTSTCPFT